MTTSALPAARPAKALTPYEFWGRMLVLPYLLVFLVFVLYPVGYGLWLARHPESYVKLFDDPIFFRTAVNTLVFLVVAINVKMVIALVCRASSCRRAGGSRSCRCSSSCPGRVPSIPTILSVRFMLNPEWGVINSTYLPPDRAWTARTG